MNAITGKILWIDLSSRAWHEENVPPEVYERYLSGVGLGAWVLSQRIPPGADPMGPENVLGLVAGVLVGTGAMFSGRWMAVTKSPLTGGWGDANCGGTFAPAIKRCGYDGIFITGTSETPVYLLVDDKTVEFIDGSGIWGRDTVETEAELIQIHGKKAKVACIGPAGEKLSLIAGIANDRGRLAGRSGVGAVMGSKKLKAVVLVGTQTIRAADPDTFKKYNQQVSKLMPRSELPIPGWLLPLMGKLMMGGKNASRTDGMMVMGLFRKWGTTVANQLSVVTGDSPVKNWRGLPNNFKTSALGPHKISKSIKKRYACYNCPLGCGAILETRGKYKETHRPEYENTCAFGALLLNSDLDSIMNLNEFINRAGLDSISAGATAAFAIDCFENGLLTEKDTDGLQLHWGNTQEIITLVKMMVERKGIGDLLADGVRIASQKIGPGSEKFAFHAGGQELPMHDPRQDPGYGVFYAGDATPGRHTTGSLMQYDMLRLWTRVSWAPEPPRSYPVAERYEASEQNGVKLAATAQFKSVLDGAGLCFFATNIGADRLGIFELLNAAAGWDKTPDEYMDIGKRIQAARMAFNVKHGIEPSEVTLNPVVIGDPPVTEGPSQGRHFDLSAMRSQYWKALGWDSQTGHPAEELLIP